MIRKFALAAFAVLSLSGCATALENAPVRPIAGEAVRESNLDDRALIAAESAWNVAATAYLSANGRGLLSPALAADIRSTILDAKVALDLARDAYDGANAKTLGAQAKIALDLAHRARAMIPKG